MRAVPLLILLACGGAEEPLDDTGAEDEAPKKPRARLLERVEAEFAEYTGWEQIPDWEGVQPSDVGLHGESVAIYYNDAAMGALTGEADGASSFKEVYGSAGTVAALHVMTYDDAYGWFYAVMGPSGTVDDAGRLIGCTGCHETSTRSGFLAP